MSYRALIDIDCLSVLPKSGKRRDDVISFCSNLCNNLFEDSDFQVIESDSRRVLEVSIRSGFAITWWVDDPVKRVVIVDIERL